MRTSILGMGRMGEALAERIVSGGHEVTVWNRSPGKAGPAVEAGATEAASLDEAVTSAEVVLTMLADDRAVDAVSSEVARSLGADAVYIDSSTVSPALSQRLAERFERYVALPVLGSPDAVRTGQAAFLAGGRAEVLDRIEPLLASLSGRVNRLDSPAVALGAKLTGNYLLLGGLAVLAEAFEVGRAGGLSDEQLRSVFAESPLVAPGLRNRFEGVLAGSTEGWFTMTLGGKDVRLGLDLAGGAGRDLPVGAALAGVYAAAESHGLSDADVAGLRRIYDLQAG